MTPLSQRFCRRRIVRAHCPKQLRNQFQAALLVNFRIVRDPVNGRGVDLVNRHRMALKG